MVGSVTAVWGERFSGLSLLSCYREGEQKGWEIEGEGKEDEKYEQNCTCLAARGGMESARERVD